MPTKSVAQELVRETAHHGESSSTLLKDLLEELTDRRPSPSPRPHPSPVKARPRSRYSGILESVIHGISSRQDEIETLRLEARRDFADLMKRESAARRQRVERSISRFRSPHLVDLLLEASREKLMENPFEAQELAECAYEVALKLPDAVIGSTWAMTCLARAAAQRGNALRVQGEFRKAEPLLTSAMQIFSERGDQDPLILAELLGLMASFRMEQRRYSEAASMIDEAVEIYTVCQEHLLLHRMLIKKAMLLSDTERTTEAIQVVSGVLAGLDPQEQPRLYLAAQHNLAHYLQVVERFDEAHQVLTAQNELYERFDDPWTRLRHAWSLGQITRGMGRLDEAEEILRGVREGFQAEGLPYDAALAGLDLALIYVDTARTTELKSLAGEMVAVFQAQDIHREATAAVLLFQEAARQEEVTGQMVADLIGVIQRLRRARPGD